MPKKNQPKKINLSGVVILAVLGFLALATSLVLVAYTDFPPMKILIISLAAYLTALILVTVLLAVLNRFALGTAEMSASIFGSISLDLIQKIHLPLLICDDKGKIIWYNRALSSKFHSKGVLYGKYVDNICNATVERIRKGAEEVVFLAAGEVSDEPMETYQATDYCVSSRGKVYDIIVFENTTEVRALSAKLADEDTIIAYAVIDNLDELMQYVQELYGNAANEVEKILRHHMERIGGVIRSYSHNKFICMFAAKHLAALEQDRFSMLDEVREIRVGSTSMPVTISMGIAKIPGTLYEKERATQSALDMALQRGGDQVVVKTPEDFEFYGGKIKTIPKRTKVRARVIANELLMLISAADNVLVMGHKFPDFDAFASCIAVARLAKFCGVQVFIVMDKDSPNIKACSARLENDPEYENLFIDRTVAQDMIRSNTLAIVVDVNNLEFCEAPDVVNTVKDLVIIDHHRKTAEFKNKPKIVYIEPSASSASELLSEFLEQILMPGTLPKIESEFLLAGMLLDTKHFTHNTGVRTFSSALYLRGEGANPLEAQEYFKMNVNDFVSEAKFENNIVVYKSVIAIALNESEDNTMLERVNAARAADRLLGVEGVQASFALCRIDDTVHISARSQGKINVQLILEKMGGGGHFDSAGAQKKSYTLEKALEELRRAIDEYFDENM